MSSAISEAGTGRPQGLVVEFDVAFHRKAHGRKTLRRCDAAVPGAEPSPPPPGSIPRVARLMALAIHFDELIRQREVAGYAELARLGRVTRARLTQIMNLLHLAPDLQEQVLHLPLTVEGRDALAEHHLRPIAAVVDWTEQRRMWADLTSRPARRADRQTDHGPTSAP